MISITPVANGFIVELPPNISNGPYHGLAQEFKQAMRPDNFGIADRSEEFPIFEPVLPDQTRFVFLELKEALAFISLKLS